MKTFSQSLMEQLSRNLEGIHLQNEEALSYSELAVRTILNTLEELKLFLASYSFPTKNEEILFFKEIKPQFTSLLIYYNEIYKMESNLPFGTASRSRKYYEAELVKLQGYFDENVEFYRYHQKGNTFLDKKYFIRSKYDLKLTLDSFYLQADRSFSTSHDYQIARLIANERLKKYIESKIVKIEQLKNLHEKEAATTSNIKWTSAKVEMVEMIYALHTAGVFNHGGANLKELIRHFEKAFNVELGQFHRTYTEISARKTDRTKFLNIIQEKLVRRMDDKDSQ